MKTIEINLYIPVAGTTETILFEYANNKQTK